MKICTLIACLIASISYSQTPYKASNAQQLSWTGKAAFSTYTPEGTLKLMSASLLVNDTTIETLAVVVDMRSLEQENTQLRDHLRAADFFHVEKFPVATFELTEPASIENGNLTLNGQMTIKGETRSEQIQATVTSLATGIRLKFEHRIDRTQYGIIFNSPTFFEKLKDQAISDEFVLKATLEFVPPGETGTN